MCANLVNGPIFQESKKEIIVALLLAKAEYMAMTKKMHEDFYLR